MQEVKGTFLYYAQAIYCTMLTALSVIATKQAAPMATTLKNTNQFLDDDATNDKAVLTYKVSNMVLTVNSNASYLNEPQARSMAGEHFFMYTMFPSNNGMIHNTAQVIKAVMLSAAEVELGALYINAKFAAPIRHTIKKKKAAPNHQRRYEQTTQLHLVLEQTKSSQR